VPALAQITLMGRVLKGEPIGALDAALPVLLSLLLALVSVLWVARTLRSAALK
jgi:sodium transport system permease protein